MSDGGFSLGTFSPAEGAPAAVGAKPFPGVVLGERVVPLAVLAPELRARGVPPESCESLQGLLEDWQHAFPLLRDIVRDLQGGERVAEAGGGHVAEAGGERVAEAGGERVAEAGGGRVAEAGGAAAAEAGAFERLPQPLPADAIALAQLRVHAPLPKPGTIYCSGANYKKHVAELIVAHQNDERTRGMSLEEKRAWAMALMDRRAESGTPFIFVKPQSAVTGPFDPIAVPDVSEKPDWELELAVIIGRRARRVSRATALDYVAGYTIANDITLREKVFRRKTDSPELGMDFVISKGAPGFLPLGPYLVPAAFVPDPQKLRLTLKLNGQVMQDEDTTDMIFSVARLIEYVSAGVELQPGDVICTGSPAGNGAHYRRFIQDGDVLEASITGLGVQRNSCVLDRR